MPLPSCLSSVFSDSGRANLLQEGHPSRMALRDDETVSESGRWLLSPPKASTNQEAGVRSVPGLFPERSN